MFKPVAPFPQFGEMEKRITSLWEKEKVLEKYLARNKSSAEHFSFFDGPITANNPMGAHHAWGRTLKDLYQRYWNMRGFAQRFQNGFDNQGLWVEVEVEKKLKFKSKKDIESYGIAKFVDECKAYTKHFAQVQIEQSRKLGYFMDWGNDYYTLSDQNNYAIWHFLKKVWQDGNLYQGRDSVPWCPRCGTAISQHEILTEEYHELTHDSIYFRLPVDGRSGEYFLAWTTTPWTLPANVALAVHPELEYVLVEEEDKDKDTSRYWLMGSLVKRVFSREVKVSKRVSGAELVGLSYRSPFADLPAVKAAASETFNTVVASKELVNAEEGTGIVHIATGGGTEDFRLGKEKGLPVLAAIDEAANYLAGFGDLTGQNAKDDPDLVLKHPLLKDFVFRIEPYTHRYPVCWRCKTELVWRVVDEWYIAMDEVRHPGAKNYRQKLQQVIGDVRWIPEFGYARELDWLKNMEDWLISKKRYWGLALPIWECGGGHFEVIGSKEELKERAVEGWEEFAGQTPHRPWVDAVKIKCSQCGQLASRIADVGNPWLDAGIVPFSTLKYFEGESGKDYWRQWFPADLVLECFPGQFKNWFYSLLAMAVVLEGKAPFKTLLGHALVRDERGEEMHKSKGNAIWFDDAAEKMGVDVMRWLYVRQDPTHNLNFGYTPADQIRRRFFLIFWNCYKFFTTYADMDGFDPVADWQLPAGQRFDFEVFPHQVLDVWILSRMNELVREVTHHLENYQNHLAAQLIERFVVDDLSTWYIRRIRDRVGPAAPDEADKKVVHRTLYSLFLVLTKVLAPFLPYLTEEIFQNLTSGAQGSWLAKLERKGAALAIRESVHLTDWPAWEKHLIDEEVLAAMAVVRQICEQGHAERKRLGQPVRQPLAQVTVSLAKGTLEEDYQQLIMGELNVKAVKLVRSAGELTVKLKDKITPELRLEGSFREMVRSIQSARRQAGCRLDELVEVTYPDRGEFPKAAAKFAEELKRLTLAAKLSSGQDYAIKRTV